MLITKLHAGVDLDILDGFIANRYSDIILHSNSWKRLEGEAVIQVPPSYNVGTIAAQQGSNIINGTGTVWTPEMSGLMVRINFTSEYYQFSYVSGTQATLDRPYEGSTQSIVASAVSAGGSGYLVGDQFWVIGGNNLAQGVVETVSSSGAVTSYSIEKDGNGYVVGMASTTGGTGSGFTISITQVGTRSGLPYRIDQNIFVMPAECRIIRGVRPLHDWKRGLNRMSPHELNQFAPTRSVYGTPYHYVPTWDSQNDPPQMQVELYPVPSSPDSQGATLSFVVDYVYDPAPIDPTQTSSTLLPWLSPTAILEGVSADIQLHVKENVGLSNAHEQKYERAVKEMAMVNAQQRGPVAMKLADEFKGNTRRGYRRGPRHEGFTG